MFYIDLADGRMRTASGSKTAALMHLVEAQMQEFEFAFFQDRRLYTIPEDSTLVIAGDVVENNETPAFSATGIVADDRQSVKFFISTNSLEYQQRIRASNTPCFVDICIKSAGDADFRRLVRFNAIADARLNIEARVTDFSEITVTAADVLSGKKFIAANGSLQTGAIPYVTAQCSENQVIVPAGFFAETQTLTVQTADKPVISGNKITLSAGYQPAEQTFQLGTPHPGGEYIPDNTDQTVSAGSYLENDLVIKGDSNFIAGNIAAGKTVFNIRGTYTSDATAAADDIRSGKSAYINGRKITGSVPDTAGSLAGNVVTIPAGFIPEQQTVTVPQAAEPVVNANSVVINKGYYPEKTTVTIPQAQTPTVHKNVVTVYKGYYPQQQEIETESGYGNIQYGYINDEGLFQPLNLAETTPLDIGDAESFSELDMFKTNRRESTYTDDEFGIFFYRCSMPPTALDSLLVSGAGNTEYNGLYIGMENAFDGSGNSGLLRIWYKEGTDSYSADHKAIAVYANKNAYSILIAKGYIESNGKFMHQSYPYRIDQNISTVDEAINLMNSNIWTVMTGSSGGIDPGPTVEYLLPSGTWSGHKMIQNSDGSWSQEDAETTNLPIKGATPVVGGIYSKDTTVTISAVYEGSNEQ